jgi:hypothetical protein
MDHLFSCRGDAKAEAETKVWAENFRPYIGEEQETVEPITGM